MNEPRRAERNHWHVFLVFLRLGLTSFGGPIAHLGYFREEFVCRRQWLSEQNYAELVAVCQFLPGPASSQVGMALGLLRCGYGGAVAAWIGFTLPSAMALIAFGLGLATYDNAIPTGVMHGLQVVAVSVVAQAVWGMVRTMCPDVARVSIMAAAACFLLLMPSTAGQMVVIIIAAVLGLMLLTPRSGEPFDPLPIPLRRRAGLFWLGLFFVLLIGLPISAELFSNPTLSMLDGFYRTGSLVFGGGHIVLPLLQAEVVPRGWVSNDVFLAGYGAAQAIPGPLFTFAAFLGASMNQAPSGWLGGLICLLAIFAPSFLLVLGTLPFWAHVRRNRRVQAALLGINAAVVGMLLAALYQPIWTGVILNPLDFGMALVALVALMFWKWPPWLVVLGSGFLGWLFNDAFCAGC
nr:chromate efflux transporter [uncultured Pseudomonas sp.]